jgi:DNA repair exonuclease SbcCD ATPase subunit
MNDDVFANGAPIKVSRPPAPVLPSTSVDLEERYKRVMMTNAQLDNDKQVLQYEVDLLKDRLVDWEERFLELEHQHGIRCRELTNQKSSIEEWKTKCKNLQDLLSQRDALIKEHGLLFVTVGEPAVVPTSGAVSSALLSLESAELLSDYEGSLGERLGKFFQDKIRLEDENKRLQRELEAEKSRAALTQRFPLCSDGISVPGSPGISVVDAPVLDAETQKNITEYKLKLKRAEQEILTLTGAVTRLECQVNRYKSAAETSEKAEEELKQEKRRLLKELRESQTALQDLETKNGHLMKRLEKAKYRNVTDAN